jgi:hypothetical protein
MRESINNGRRVGLRGSVSRKNRRLATRVRIRWRGFRHVSRFVPGSVRAGHGNQVRPGRGAQVGAQVAMR